MSNPGSALASTVPGSRFPASSPDDLPPAQRALHERIVAERGKLPPPYRTLLSSPNVAALVEQLSRQLWQGALPRAILEAVFLSVARTQQCRYQWESHAVKALEAGITKESVDAIRGGHIPDQSQPLAAALTFVHEMQSMKRARDGTFAAVITHFGDQGLAELCAFLGFATSISFLLNAQQADADACAPLEL